MLGEEIAESQDVSERKLDQRPGAVPDIRVEGDCVIYSLDVPSERAQLIIRCDSNGTVLASLAPRR